MGGFQTNLQIENERIYCAVDEHFWHWRQTRLNTLVLETKALKTRIQTSATHSHAASYQRLPNRPYVEMIATPQILTSENRR